MNKQHILILWNFVAPFALGAPLILKPYLSQSLLFPYAGNECVVREFQRASGSVLRYPFLTHGPKYVRLSSGTLDRSRVEFVIRGKLASGEQKRYSIRFSTEQGLAWAIDSAGDEELGVFAKAMSSQVEAREIASSGPGFYFDVMPCERWLRRGHSLR